MEKITISTESSKDKVTISDPTKEMDRKGEVLVMVPEYQEVHFPSKAPKKTLPLLLIRAEKEGDEEETATDNWPTQEPRHKFHQVALPLLLTKKIPDTMPKDSSITN